MLEERGMRLRPRIQTNLKDDEMSETYYKIPHTGARLVHLTCVARGKIKDNGEAAEDKNWTEFCAETEALETAHVHYLKVLNAKLRIEKRLLKRRETADEEWKHILAEAKKLWKRDEELEKEMKELESDCADADKQLDKLRIMKWICCEWSLRLCMHSDRIITKNQHPWKEFQGFNIGKYFDLQKKAVVDSEFKITHDTEKRASVYEQTNFFRKRVCGFVEVSYFDENPHLQDFLYKKTKYGGERRLSFWKREGYNMK